MSWHCSRVLVEEFWEATCLDGERFAPSSSTPMPEAYYWPDKTTEHSRLSRFGMTSEPLTADRGGELLMWFLEGSRAKTLASQEKATDLTENAADCGQKWRGWFAKYDHDSCLWKTAQCSLLGDLTVFSETWPQWGLMRNGECWEQTMSALPTVESASGLWPTPTVCGNYNRKGLSKTSGDGLATAVKKWPTPVASMSKGSSPASLTRASGKSRQSDRLDHAVMASDGGQLNPDWVEWLMGWPIGWTDLKLLETDKFQRWQQLHGESFQEREAA